MHTKDSGTNHVLVNLWLTLYKLTGWLDIGGIFPPARLCHELQKMQKPKKKNLIIFFFERSFSALYHHHYYSRISRLDSRTKLIPKLFLRLLWFFRRTVALFRQIRTFPQFFRFCSDLGNPGIRQIVRDSMLTGR